MIHEHHHLPQRRREGLYVDEVCEPGFQRCRVGMSSPARNLYTLHTTRREALRISHREEAPCSWRGSKPSCRLVANVWFWLIYRGIQKIEGTGIRENGGKAILEHWSELQQDQCRPEFPSWYCMDRFGLIYDPYTYCTLRLQSIWLLCLLHNGLHRSAMKVIKNGLNIMHSHLHSDTGICCLKGLTLRLGRRGLCSRYGRPSTRTVF
ncbi:uncharacterized protein LOC124692021 [Lolium rigidum]|uniref:uncharacterized protein LOC124692021 n=1 Tax=Lolium rigidum TaxID=89674 RepID=UPI001F5DB0AF|nr:uncharacterized protein LOC124692021 [Lolium rigidum]XP_047081274.1 uncharacterized protein LOC124692021 [Lolium rigidum]